MLLQNSQQVGFYVFFSFLFYSYIILLSLKHRRKVAHQSQNLDVVKEDQLKKHVAKSAYLVVAPVFADIHSIASFGVVTSLIIIVLLRYSFLFFL